MNAEPAKEGAATPGWVRDLEKRRQQVKTHELWNIFVLINTVNTL